jgi:hypothetical protein
MRTVPAIAEGIAVVPGLGGENVPVTGVDVPDRPCLNQE